MSTDLRNRAHLPIRPYDVIACINRVYAATGSFGYPSIHALLKANNIEEYHATYMNRARA